MRQKTGQCDKAGMSGWGNRSKADVVWNRAGEGEGDAMEDGGGREGSRISREVGQARHSDSERGIIITCRRGGEGGGARR